MGGYFSYIHNVLLYNSPNDTSLSGFFRGPVDHLAREPVSNMITSIWLVSVVIILEYMGVPCFPIRLLFNLTALQKHRCTCRLPNEFIRNITSGVIASAHKLPGTRTLSTLLAVHRKTVVTAYDELEAQGWIEIRPNRGCYVNHELPLVLSESNEASGQPHKVAQFKVSPHVILHSAGEPLANP